jgi:carboxymethylenebutenolidase
MPRSSSRCSAFYGIPPLDTADLKKIKVPLVCHFANKDDWCTPAKVNDLEAALKQSKSQFEIYRYEAHHAFMNPDRYAHWRLDQEESKTASRVFQEQHEADSRA